MPCNAWVTVVSPMSSRFHPAPGPATPVPPAGSVALSLLTEAEMEPCGMCTLLGLLRVCICMWPSNVPLCGRTDRISLRDTQVEPCAGRVSKAAVSTRVPGGVCSRGAGLGLGPWGHRVPHA